MMQYIDAELESEPAFSNRRKASTPTHCKINPPPPWRKSLGVANAHQTALRASWPKACAISSRCCTPRSGSTATAAHGRLRNAWINIDPRTGKPATT